ncbi:MAG TPA: 4-hydroxy-3-methylbut-2-enyl diphosphate reductase [Pseudomonadales bacterium]|nr:4-hydroxy-3-methylbut-2-enyl diphosphate reductase [Pseudomonadales bacterium]HMW82576.1 4-hydroxy-3-methylbut-2-enyl diphosphate reductase [Pseudomonadales bacterium]HMY96286.1 4-hydroxy-3-methylbut-2-enyl diphosphate reductase [Pseudomonadales bacterium]HMZ69960.1 4-hydroxy-3-methylbut-2-enyl diphosphate reductase [Pseudomonadales bacterium]HMZ91118.1 4-hydroxy-3-methylbut-2-enyl diphosphate reductase [Pseudomonadales bacterium]
MKVLLANPRGFCAGVDRAIEIVNRALDLFGAPIYVRHEVVHNRHVVDTLRERGAIFVEEVEEIPEGATAIFSAHGVSRAVRQAAEARRLRLFDATCPLVTKVHMEVARLSQRGIDCVLIGHAGHPEVEGTMGQYDLTLGGAIHLVESLADVERLQVRDPARLAYATQTTLSLDDTARIVAALRARYPLIGGPRKEDICYATQNRQDAVRALAQEVDLLLVIGSPNSSNSNRLQELAQRMGVAAYLIENAGALQPDWLRGCRKVGVTAGASAPDVLVRQLIDRLLALGADSVEERAGRSEEVVFSLPRELKWQEAQGTPP